MGHAVPAAPWSISAVAVGHPPCRHSRQAVRWLKPCADSGSRRRRRPAFAFGNGSDRSRPGRRWGGRDCRSAGRHCMFGGLQPRISAPANTVNRTPQQLRSGREALQDGQATSTVPASASPMGFNFPWGLFASRFRAPCWPPWATPSLRSLVKLNYPTTRPMPCKCWLPSHETDNLFWRESLLAPIDRGRQELDAVCFRERNFRPGWGQFQGPERAADID